MKNYNDYIREIKNLGRWLITRAEDIVLTEDDYKNKLRSITLYTRLSLDEIPAWDISKEFLPLETTYYIDGVCVPKRIVDEYVDNLVECTTWKDASNNDIRYASIGLCDKLEEVLDLFRICAEGNKKNEK